MGISFTIQEFKQEYFQNKTNYRIGEVICKNPKMELRCNEAPNCNKNKISRIINKISCRLETTQVQETELMS